MSGKEVDCPLTAWMSTKFPLELPAAFGIKVVCPESAAAAAAGRGEGARLCRAAEDMDYCGDLCSYVRMGMALAGELPRPDMLLCCDNICSGMVQWYQNLSRRLKVPMLLLDIPYGQEERVTEQTVNYVRAQMEAVIRGLEGLTGQPFDPERFGEVCRQADRSARAWQEVLDVALSHPMPLRNMELFDYMPWMVTERCDQKTEQRLLALSKELRTRPAAKKDGAAYRIFWEGTPCWPVQNEMVRLLDERGIQIVADTITPSLLFRYGDLDGLIRAYCATINGVSLERGVAMRAELCRRYRVDGVLVHYNRSCRPWCGALQEVERRLRGVLDLPVVSFDGDQGDPGAFSLASFETRLDALVEQMERRRT